MANFTKIFISFMFLGLIILSIFALIIGMQEDNDVQDKFIEDGLMSSTFSDLNNSLGSLSTQSQTQKSLFESENPTSGFGTILLFSIVSSGKIFNGMIIGIFNILIKLPLIILGFDVSVLSVINTILIYLIIVGLWILYKLGG